MTLHDDGSASVEQFSPPDEWDVPVDWHREDMEAFVPSLPSPEEGVAIAGAAMDSVGGILRMSADG